MTNSSSGDYRCYALLTPWDQSTVTWNQASSGILWGAPGASSGADRDNQILCNVAARSTGSLTVNLTAEGLAVVQAWVNDPAGNHGLIISGPATADGADFHSSESSTAMSRPKLNVTYQVPATPGNIDPVAGFTFSCTDLDCGFTDTSSDSDGTIVGWAWDFGDGNSSTGQHPAHTYTFAGDYTVSLTVTDNGA